jgi:hypothetical protein
MSSRGPLCSAAATAAQNVRRRDKWAPMYPVTCRNDVEVIGLEPHDFYVANVIGPMQ